MERKKLLFAGNKELREREGGCRGKEHPCPTQGHVLLLGVLRRTLAVPDLCSHRASLSADNVPVLTMERKPKMGQEAVPMSGVRAPRNHQRQLLQ